MGRIAGTKNQGILEETMARLALAATALLALGTASASAAQIRVTCYSDGNECETAQGIAQDFMKDNPDIKVEIDKVPYKAILQACRCSSPPATGPTSRAPPISARSRPTCSTSAPI